MDRETFHILVVGPTEPYSEFFDSLEADENYCLHFAADLHSASLERAKSYFPEHQPSVILLTVPRGQAGSVQVLGWLEDLKSLAPVIVLSPVEDMQLYLGAMYRGAFDYFTAYTPVEEIKRGLAHAVSRYAFQAA